jgi:hypothetical protein
MSPLATPWRRWAVAAPAATFVVAVLVLAPGGIPSVGLPAAVEVGAGTSGEHTGSGAVVDQASTTGDEAGGSAAPSAGTHGSRSGGETSVGSTTGGTSRPGTTRPSAEPSDNVTVVSAQQPVVVDPGGWGGGDGDGAGDDNGAGDDDHSPSPSHSPRPSPSPTGSRGGDGSGDR